MKLQRYYVDKYDIGRGVCYNEDVVVLEGKYNALEAENAALHAECDRLTAMLGPQKVLSAEEVAKPGFYWWRGCKESDWNLVDVFNDREDFIMFTIGDDCDKELVGQFVGPLKTPEVQG